MTGVRIKSRLIPLLLVASFLAKGDYPRMLALLPLGLAGARLFSSIQRHHFSPRIGCRQERQDRLSFYRTSLP